MPCLLKFRNKIVLPWGKLVDLADENVLRNIVAVDVTWFPGYDVATKAQSFTLGLKNFTQIKKERPNRPVWKWCCFLWPGRNSEWISTSWPDGELGMNGMWRWWGREIQWGEKEPWVVEGEMVASSRQWSVCYLFPDINMRRRLSPSFRIRQPCISGLSLSWNIKRTSFWVWNSQGEQHSIPKEAFQECFQNSKKCRERCMTSVVYLERVKA